MVQHKFTFEGLTIPYYVFGKGKPIIFFHGLGANPFTYQTILTLLSRDFCVIAPGIPPFGRAPTPKDVWNFSNYAHYFSAFVDSLGYERVTVLGHSYGGGIGMYLSMKNTHIDHLILINPIGIPLKYKQWHIVWNVFRKSCWLFLLGKETIMISLIGDFFQTVMYRLSSLPTAVKIIHRSMYHSMVHFKEIPVPTSILWGTEDELLSPEYVETLREMIPHATVYPVSGYHNWCFFKPEIVYKHVLAALNTE